MYLRVLCLLGHDPLHLIERDLIAAAIIQARRARRLVRGHLLRDFQLAAVFEIPGNSGCAERVAPDQGFDARARGFLLVSRDATIRRRLKWVD